MITRLNSLDSLSTDDVLWASSVVNKTSEAFHDIHNGFLAALAEKFGGAIMDQSGTTATVMLVNSKTERRDEDTVILASLGDSRAVLSRKTNGTLDGVQLTKDHTASDPNERKFVEERGGFVKVYNGVARVNGSLVVTRSIGDAALAGYLSQTPDVYPFRKQDLLELCVDFKSDPRIPCFVILASDGLWDTVDNQEAVRSMLLHKPAS